MAGRDSPRPERALDAADRTARAAVSQPATPLAGGSRTPHHEHAEVRAFGERPGERYPVEDAARRKGVLAPGMLPSVQVPVQLILVGAGANIPSP
jgi:hypothetical protein